MGFIVVPAGRRNRLRLLLPRDHARRVGSYVAVAAISDCLLSSFRLGSGIKNAARALTGGGNNNFSPEAWSAGRPDRQDVLASIHGGQSERQPIG